MGDIRKSEYFMFSKTILELIQNLDAETFKQLTIAIVEYWTEWKITNFEWTYQVLFNVLKDKVDSDNKNRLNKSMAWKKHKWNQYTRSQNSQPTTKEDVKPHPVVEDNSSVKKEWLKKYWQYVELTDEEYKKLIYQFGSCSWYTYQWEAHLKLNRKPVDDKIESMNNYIINWKWKPYPDYYMELRYRFKREWKNPYWERGSAEEMKAYLEKENNRQLYYRAYVEFREKIDYIKHTLWKIDIIKNQEFFDEYDWHFFLDY